MVIRKQVDTGLVSQEERQKRGLDFKKMGALTPAQSAASILDKVDSASRDGRGGKFIDAKTGDTMPF